MNSKQRRKQRRKTTVVLYHRGHVVATHRLADLRSHPLPFKRKEWIDSRVTNESTFQELGLKRKTTFQNSAVTNQAG